LSGVDAMQRISVMLCDGGSNGLPRMHILAHELQYRTIVGSGHPRFANGAYTFRLRWRERCVALLEGHHAGEALIEVRHAGQLVQHALVDAQVRLASFRRCLAPPCANTATAQQDQCAPMRFRQHR